MKPAIPHSAKDELLLFIKAQFLIKYHLSEKTLHSMSQGPLMENQPHDLMRECHFSIHLLGHSSKRVPS